jgi:hypothetical protein
MIPVNLVLVAWVWFGRAVFGVGGWLFLIYLVSVVPVLLIGLSVTTLLGFTQPGRPRTLTRQQALAQVAVWVGMLGFGTFSIDVGDDMNSETSLLTQLFGYSGAALAVTWALMLVFAGITVAAWVALVVTLTAGRRRADSDAVTPAR